MSNQAAVSSSGIKCPVCGGSGIELYKALVTEYDKDTPVWFGRPCVKCKGQRRTKDITGVPSQFYEADLSKFRFDLYSRNVEKLEKLVRIFFGKFRDWEKAGKGLFIWSQTPGSGKTFLSCCLGKSIMVRYDLRMRFVAVPDYLAAVGASYKRELGTVDESQIYRECDLLVFDDIGAQKAGDWQGQELFRIVNERLNAGKVTIYTANMPPEKLNVNERTIDRIMKSSVVIQMPEESIRRKQAKEEQDYFISRMLGG